MSDRHIELTWRCSACRAQNLGRHMVCTSCGDPKDDREVYEMPAAPEAAPSVVDPALLQMAEAGANWSCAYCGSDQRDLDGGCGRCGAGRAAGANAKAPRSADGGDPEEGRRGRLLGPHLGIVVTLVSLVALGVGAYAAWPRAPKAVSVPAPPPREAAPVFRELDATVASVGWTRTVRVERWALATHEGFVAEAPPDARDVRTTGTREHHVEQVPDGFELVSEEVEVPAGTRTETTTERVRCGEDCTTTPKRCRQSCSRTTRSCKQVCTNKKNGFASCRDECTGGEETCREECTGGDRRCETRWCNETRTRQVPWTRRETRTHQRPRTKSVSRFAPWGTYKTWEWTLDHVEESRGDDVTPQWPDAGARTYPTGKSGPSPGELRAERSETFRVTLRLEGVPRGELSHFPASPAELARFAPGVRVRVRVGPGDALTILDRAPGSR